MSDSDHVQKLFDDITHSMRAKFQGWEQDLPHEGEKGGLRERRVAELLKSILPKCFGVGSGHIIDKQGKTSGQIDIVIYNSLYGIHFPIDDNYSLFPCECVYAAIEVKSILTASNGINTRGSIIECIETTNKVKILQKDDMETPNDILCVVFAYHTSWKKEPGKVREWFSKLASGQKLPEITFVLDPGYLLCTYGDGTVYTNSFRKAPLLKFYEELLERMQQVEMMIPNLWHEYIRWGTGEVLGSIYIDNQPNKP